jgi:hypothetical protein
MITSVPVILTFATTEQLDAVAVAAERYDSPEQTNPHPAPTAFLSPYRAKTQSSVLMGARA